MNRASQGALALVAAGLAAGPCVAQALRDPMRPPAFAVASRESAETAAPVSPMVLQSTLLSGGRRIAMIDGKPLKVGDRIGEAQILAIDSHSVTLREADKTRVLELTQGVQVIRRSDEKAAAARKASGGGDK
jgi:MSHA biogenesis protein MshK